MEALVLCMVIAITIVLAVLGGAIQNLVKELGEVSQRLQHLKVQVVDNTALNHKPKSLVNQHVKRHRRRYRPQKNTKPV